MTGPMYYKGIYHLFYQYNPYGAVWGNIVWAHSVSNDLINWKALKPAIYPTKPFDVNGIPFRTPQSSNLLKFRFCI